MTKSERLFIKAWREESKDINFDGLLDKGKVFGELSEKLLSKSWMWTGWRRAIEMMEKDDKSND